MRFTLIMLCCVVHLLAWGCGPSGRRTDVQAGQVLMATDAGTGDHQPQPAGALVDLILRDEQRAVAIITASLSDKNRDVASWAAVYACRLGIKQEEGAVNRALRQGVHSADPLLQALCWRWIAARNLSLKTLRSAIGDVRDPVVAAMAALAFAARGSLPPRLSTALGLKPVVPTGVPSADRSLVKRRVERLIALTTPFDTGALALAIVFVQARRQEWAEKNASNRPSWVAERLRAELAGVVWGDDPTPFDRIKTSESPEESTHSRLVEQLETPLIQHPPRVLRAAALTGEPGLRRTALRALAVIATTPLAGDLGAASAAMASEDSGIQLEGARTFLLLSSRARNK